MNPLHFTPMISHSSNHLITHYVRQTFDKEPRACTAPSDIHAQALDSRPANWRAYLAHHLSAWTRRRDPHPNC